ncbi:MAG: hypothetical protein QOJ39_3209 [Candidatus Eremiobacteraeota bacterium]|nr:hypothetical protein [Candidatus Eremiobacteraeota bacterium]MEA2721345.1 hypothetical protein [Candidatus Eremiobacteraeota bacterium]
MKSRGKNSGERPRFGNTWLKAFVWVLLAIFVLTSVGVALVTTTAAR